MAVVTEQRVDPTSSSGQPFGWQQSGDANSRVNVGGVERWLSLMVGAAMIYRGVTGFCRVYQALGINHANGHARERGTGVIADRGSDTRRRLGGHRGIHVEEAVTINRPVCGGVSLLAQLRESSQVHAASRVGGDAGRRHLALGRQRPGRDEGRMGRPDHQRGSTTRSSAGSRSRARWWRPPVPSTSTTPTAALWCA